MAANRDHKATIRSLPRLILGLRGLFLDLEETFLGPEARLDARNPPGREPESLNLDLQTTVVAPPGAGGRVMAGPGRELSR